MTGNESVETCFWCGAATKRRYCKGTDCRSNYVSRFHWFEAKLKCLRSARVAGPYYDPVVKCQDCGICGYVESVDYQWDRENRYRRLIEQEGISYFSGFEVHHVVPLLGANRNWHWLNQYLVLLCRRCHTVRHVQLNYLLKRADGKVDSQTDRQLTLW